MLRYAITDRHLLPSEQLGAPLLRDRQSTHGWEEDALVAQAAQLAERGDIDYLQLREKDLPPAALAALARRMLEVLHTYAPDPARRVRLLINSRVDVAIAVGADGVHLTSSAGELTAAQVRALYATAGLLPPTVSLSCHTVADVIAARGLRSEDELCFAPDPAAAPDLILFGPVFEKRVGDEVVAKGFGLELLRQACAAASPIPVVALGGVTQENTTACVDAGAGIAAIRLFSI